MTTKTRDELIKELWDACKKDDLMKGRKIPDNYEMSSNDIEVLGFFADRMLDREQSIRAKYEEQIAELKEKAWKYDELCK
jgi:hypothetical protein